MKTTATLLALSLLGAASGRAQLDIGQTPSPLAAPAAKLKDVSGVLAHVGAEDFKLDDIRPYLAKLTAEQKEALAKDPATLNKFVRTFLVQRLLLQEALAAKWDQQPDAAAQLRRIRENAIADGYLASVSTVPADYPAEKDLEAAYEANKAAFVTPRQLRLAQILIEAPKDQSPKAGEMAAARVEMVRKALQEPGADFVKVAQTKATETGNLVRGGEIGWVPEAKLPAEVREVVLKLQSGSTTDPVQLKDGWAILKLLEVKEPAQLSLADVRGVLTKRLREIKARQASEAYVNRLIEKNPITINETAITQALAGSLN